MRLHCYRLLPQVKRCDNHKYVTQGERVVLLVVPLVQTTHSTPAAIILHVHTRYFKFASKFTSDTCMATPEMQVRTKQRSCRPHQPDGRPAPNPDPNTNPSSTFWIARNVPCRLEVGSCSPDMHTSPLKLRAKRQHPCMYLELYVKWFDQRCTNAFTNQPTNQESNLTHPNNGGLTMRLNVGSSLARKHLATDYTRS